MPHYQASSIWGNSHNCFNFLLSVLFFNIRFNNNFFLDKKNIFFSMLLTMAAYKAILRYIFPFMLLKIYKINKFREVFYYFNFIFIGVAWFNLFNK